MRLAPAFLVAMTATASADVEWKWNRVIVDNPQSESARAIAADLDSLRIARALEPCAHPGARAVVTIVYDRTVRVTVDADVDHKLQLCVERALKMLAPLWTRDGVVRQWVTAELIATSTLSDSLMYRGTRQTAPLWIEARASVPHVDPDQRLWLRGVKIKR